jgi:hypothetical protein
MWLQDPEVPAPGLLAASKAVEAEARRLAKLFVDEQRREPLIVHLFSALASWSVVVGRWATTGPEHDRATQRAFADHPEAGTADQFAAFRSAADELAFYAIGADVVLETFGDLALARRGVELEPGAGSWNKLVGTIDGNVLAGRDEPLRDPARYLMLALVEGRNRLVAHRRADHAAITGWDREGITETTLMRAQMPWDTEGAAQEARRRAAESLLGILDKINHAPVPTELGEVGEERFSVPYLLDVVVPRAGELSLDDRRRVGNAMREAGFSTRPAAEVVEVVLRLTASITAN